MHPQWQTKLSYCDGGLQFLEEYQVLVTAPGKRTAILDCSLMSSSSTSSRLSPILGVQDKLMLFLLAEVTTDSALELSGS